MLTTSEATAALKVAVVRAESVNVRSGPGTGNAKIGMVNKGDKLFVIKNTGEWRQVILADGKPGWVNKSYLAVLNNGLRFTVKPVSRPPQQQPGAVNPKPTPSSVPVEITGTGRTGVVSAENVNVRYGPGTTYQIVTVAGKATRVTVHAENNGWSGVELPDGKKGWMASRYVDLRSDVSRGGDANDQQPATEQPVNPPADPPQDPPLSDNPPVEPTDSQTQPVLPQTPKLQKLEIFQQETGGDALVITGEKPISFTVSRLNDPGRLVIDIKNMDKGDIADLVPDTSDFISQIRVAQFSLNPMTVRVVVDLNGSVAYTAGLSPDALTLTLSLTEATIKGKTIVLDAGHGGHDPGTIGVTGEQEKKVNLDIALKVQKLLSDLGANVIMTRSDDTFIQLNQRAVIANNANADIFVSIHANSSTSASLGGTSTYYYAPAANPVLYNQFGQRSSLASKVQSQLAQNLGIRNIGTLTANFAVLRETKMPSILVETAFLSNKAEEALLKDDAFREKAAQAIAQGLADYFANPV